MFGDEKNLTDPEGKFATSYGAGLSIVSPTLSYSKINKLITAVYIVTDILDPGEPIRLKLRTIGLEILSDINLNYSSNLDQKIDTALSFLDVAAAINLISEMNSSILKKEFIELKQSVRDSINRKEPNPNWLEEFLVPATTASLPNARPLFGAIRHPIGQVGSKSKGHAGTRIGVQKGSTLMQALSDKAEHLSDRKNNSILLRNQRRNEIIKIIKGVGGNTTITDIKNKMKGDFSILSEKTIQRELFSMVEDGVLDRTGKKRWSKYFLA